VPENRLTLRAPHPLPTCRRPTAVHLLFRLECAKALLRAGADPNYMNGAGDLTVFWAIDGGE